MSTAGWLVVAGILAVVIAAWIAFTASRIDRLHARLDAAQSALDAQLVRRVAALRHAAEIPVELGQPSRPAGARAPTGLPAPDRARIESLAQVALTATGAERQAAENEVGRAVAELAEVATRAGSEVVLSGAQLDELHESAVRVSIARRFYNDAVRDTRALRGRRMPRLLHLAGHRELPLFFDIDDTVPPELGRT